MNFDIGGAGAEIIDRVHGLSDLELAVLLSLVSREHCVIGTPEDAVDDLVDELSLIALSVFGLRCAVVDCHAGTTLEDFATSLFVPPTTSPVSAANNNGQQQHYSSNATTATTDYFLLSPTRRPSQSSHTPGPRSPRSPMSHLPTGATVASASAASAASASALATPTTMAHIVLAKNLNCAPEAVQIQALELMRTRHIFTATAMQTTPKPFLLVAVVAAERGFLWDAGGVDACAAKEVPVTPSHISTAGTAGPKRAPHMTAHLNDFFSMGHWHDPEDGYPNIEEREEAELGAEAKDEHDTSSYNDETGTDSDSVVRLSESGGYGHSGSIHTSRPQPAASPPLFSEADIDHLATLTKEVRVDIEVLRYQMNIIAFLRIHRAVAVVGPGTSGHSCVSPIATKHFEKLAQCLAPLHRLDYVTPALVTLAARKTYLHRIRTVPVGHSGARLSAVHERTMQWGGEKAAVEALLEGVSPEDVIESVLGSVAPPTTGIALHV
ncbi:hypothetical protein F503_08876 [Ophiostoma piceae UAMH 11346]|uniref:Magnesium chelatase n=1 Tax=Ophiostoma piceae (strain UAMH 11346) TaxID=1262450 RepID=S3BP19_OPHP1|nr:hypothetical protein F503_08876 [Ophiostoma piceae UAMH 11346]